MASVNKVILIGNLGADPELRRTADGNAVCSLSIATSERYRDKAGVQQESTEWHRVVLFRRLAEIAGDHLRRGSAVFIEGALKTRKWQDKNGQNRYTTEVHGSEMMMMDQRPPTLERNASAEQAASGQYRASIAHENASKFGRADDADWESIPF